jgi:arylsulfatase A-like enzyme
VTKPRWLDLIDCGAVTIPPEDEEVHPVMAYQRISKDWKHGFSPDAVRQTRAIYYAMCAETDAMVGSVIEEVERLGLAENTYIVVTSDHGENNIVSLVDLFPTLLEMGGLRVLKIETAGKISTYAGNGEAGFSGDNVSATATKRNGPSGLAFDKAGNLPVADTYRSADSQG